MKHFALAAGLVLAATSAQSGTVDFDLLDGSSYFGPENYARTVSLDFGGKAMRVRAGQYHFQRSDNGEDVFAFCVDLANVINSDLVYNVKPDLLGDTVRDHIDRLFTSSYSTVTSADSAAAFQLALWEVVNENTGSYDIDDGYMAVTSTGAINGMAQSLLDGLREADTGGYNLSYLDAASTSGSGMGQDLVTPSPIPLPATAMLLGLGVFGLGQLRRKTA